MSNVTPLHERLARQDGSLDFEDLEGVGERFKTFFDSFLQEKKQRAVADLLQEEFPTLADNPAFVDKVLGRLNDDCVKEKTLCLSGSESQD